MTSREGEGPKPAQKTKGSSRPLLETPLGRDSSHLGHVYIRELSLICRASLGHLSLFCISLYWTSALSLEL
jgi:hypothetical protein